MTKLDVLTGHETIGVLNASTSTARAPANARPNGLPLRRSTRDARLERRHHQGARLLRPAAPPLAHDAAHRGARPHARSPRSVLVGTGGHVTPTRCSAEAAEGGRAEGPHRYAGITRRRAAGVMMRAGSGRHRAPGPPHRHLPPDSAAMLTPIQRVFSSAPRLCATELARWPVLLLQRH